MSAQAIKLPSKMRHNISGAVGTAVAEMDGAYKVKCADSIIARTWNVEDVTVIENDTTQQPSTKVEILTRPGRAVGDFASIDEDVQGCIREIDPTRGFRIDTFSKPGSGWYTDHQLHPVQYAVGHKVRLASAPEQWGIVIDHAFQGVMVKLANGSERYWSNSVLRKHLIELPEVNRKPVQLSLF